MIPFFLFVPDARKASAAAPTGRPATAELWDTIKSLPSNPNMLLFLLARIDLRRRPCRHLHLRRHLWRLRLRLERARARHLRHRADADRRLRCAHRRRARRSPGPKTVIIGALLPASSARLEFSRSTRRTFWTRPEVAESRGLEAVLVARRAGAPRLRRPRRRRCGAHPGGQPRHAAPPRAARKDDAIFRPCSPSPAR